MNIAFEHRPVLLNEVISYLNLKEDGIYLDCTVGGAGHSSKILEFVRDKGFLYCIDRDDIAVEFARNRLNKISKNFKILNDSYVNIDKLELPNLDGILFDLGVSSPQFDNSERGFSFNKESNLDMRFSQKENIFTAEYIVNNYSLDELSRIFYEYSDEPYSKIIAKAIVNYRKKKKIKTTTELSNLVINSLKGKKYIGNIHPATRVFQALRIEVNNEFENIKKALPKAINLLKKGGRLCVITFHSSEDRIVKEIFKHQEKICICPPKQPICNCNKTKTGFIVNKKAIRASNEELNINDRARSAKLRVFERI
ncbi:MAG: ribosomal RNA small subunit methyltransferase H [Candidatus Sericytochromatia bacterium]|nr:MAG: ribosomal RNA small subunit methyltransferase H [Candidatus Sericytochromatia bacterium]